MSNGELAWNAYYDEYGHEPSNYNQLQNYAKGNPNLENLNFKTAVDTFNNNKGNGRINGVEPPSSSNNLAPPAAQDTVPSDTENEDDEYYEDGDYEYYDEQQPENDDNYEYYEDDGYEYNDQEPEPAQQQIAAAPQASSIAVDVPIQSSKPRPKPPPPKSASSAARPPPQSPARPGTATATAEGDRRETAVIPPDTPVTPARVDTSHLMPSAAIMVGGNRTSNMAYGADKVDENRPCASCPCGYLCVAWTALIIALLAVIVAVMPLILYYAGDYATADSIYGSAGFNGASVRIERYHYHTFYVDERPGFNFIFDEPVTEAESWGDNFTMDWYIGSYRGWEYVWQWDFNYNFDDDPVGGWAEGNDQFMVYPFRDL